MLLKSSCYEFINITNSSSSTTSNTLTNSSYAAHNIETFYQNSFTNQWSLSNSKQSKLAFYSSIKDTFGFEPYLNLPNRKDRVNISRLRGSCHDLNIERGRYTSSSANARLTDRACRYCCDTVNLLHLEELPFHIAPIMETEEHVITECPSYHSLRSQLSEHLLSLIMLKRYDLIMSCHAPEFGRYLTKCSLQRNPHQ